MGKLFRHNKQKIELAKNDVALIFREDGHVDLSFPELEGDSVPSHALAALACSYAVMDEEFFMLIQDHFSQKALNMVQETQPAPEDTTSSPKASHLRVVS